MDDALSFRWVNPIPAISLIFASAPTAEGGKSSKGDPTARSGRGEIRGIGNFQPDVRFTQGRPRKAFRPWTVRPLSGKRRHGLTVDGQTFGGDLLQEGRQCQVHLSIMAYQQVP